MLSIFRKIKKIKNKKGWDVAQVVETLPSKHKTLNSNPGNNKNKQTTRFHAILLSYS
jgi:hypothetical protein